MMYNPQLDTFICVVEAGSFSKAAEELYISAPAVIKQINSLENSLNLQLFERTHRGLIITEAGKSLYQDAKYLIQYSKESLIRAQEAMNHNDETLCCIYDAFGFEDEFKKLGYEVTVVQEGEDTVDFDEL